MCDIIAIFNTATYDDDFSIIEDRCMIAKSYLSSWFWIDLVSIIPFELIVPKGESANLIRLSRMGRIYKILKLLKLIRLMKLSKSNHFGFLESFTELVRIGRSIRWFVMFLMFFFLAAHVIACVWIIVGNFDATAGDSASWMADHDWTDSDLYLTSFYYTITTITTVGYGDISAHTKNEKIVAILIMFTGVIAFSFASGSLTNYIQ